MLERPFVACWSVVYPLPPSVATENSGADLEPDAIWRLLQSMLLVNWNWDLFIWDLRELLRLLTTSPAEFNYLFVTDFLRARAAYLAATGPFDCTQQAVLLGLGQYKVQFVSIYYRLLVAMLRDVLGSETGTKLIGDREERLFQLAIGEVERQYIEILAIIALDPETEDDIHRHNLASWISGTSVKDGRQVTAIPEPVSVHVVTQRYGRHRLVRPGARDMVKKIRKREAFRSYLQRVGDVKRNDIEVEKLSRFSKVEGYQVVKYGDLEVQYYLTLTNVAKTTLYVVCADRTMRIYQRNSAPLGSRPKRIEVFENGRSDDDLYLVTFDSGAIGVYALDFRPHKENEHEHVPNGVWRLPCSVGSEAVGRGQFAVGNGQTAVRSGHGAVHSSVGDGQAHVHVGVPGDPLPPTTKLLTEGAASAPRVRVNVLVDAEGMVGGCDGREITDLRSHFDKRFDSVAGDMAGLREENADLKAMQAGGLFNFVKNVEVDALQLFFAILQHGDQSKAARALGIKDTTFRQKTCAWTAMDRPYRVMYRLIAWRKKVGRQILVPFNDEILHSGNGNGDMAAFLCEVLEGLRAMNGNNWAAVRDELEEVIREECGG